MVSAAYYRWLVPILGANDCRMKNICRAETTGNAGRFIRAAIDWDTNLRCWRAIMGLMGCAAAPFGLACSPNNACGPYRGIAGPKALRAADPADSVGISCGAAQKRPRIAGKPDLNGPLNKNLGKS